MAIYVGEGLSVVVFWLKRGLRLSPSDSVSRQAPLELWTSASSGQPSGSALLSPKLEDHGWRIRQYLNDYVLSANYGRGPAPAGTT